MSNHLAIATVTAALDQTILPAAQAVVNQTNVTTQRPDDPAGPHPGPRINLYLYQVSPNAAWRNVDLPTRRGDSTLVQRPQTALNLHYLITFYGDEAQLEPQRLLGSIVSTLHSRAVLTRKEIKKLIDNNQQDTDKYNFLITSDLAQQVELVKFSLLPFSLEELSKLWSVFFQTPYSLSVAYLASLVLIEEDESPQTALPVRDYNLYAVPFHQPLIEQVIAQGGEKQPIVAGSTLLIRGQRLRGEITKVMVAGLEGQPQEISDKQISLPLSSLPADSLRAGVQAVQVVHEMQMGTPLEPHSGVESNVAAFVLLPTITEIKDPNATKVTISFKPKVGKNQRVLLLLNEFNPPPKQIPHAYSFKAPKDNGIENENVEETASITFSITGVESGDYLVRVQVDGAESLLTVDTNQDSPTFNQYIDPKVTIP